MSHKKRDRMALEVGQPLQIQGIPLPPDDIFKHRGRNRADSAQEVWGLGGTVSYIPDRAEYKKGEGNFVYYKGWDEGDVKMPPPIFPSKCVSPVQTIQALAGPKRMLLNTVKFLSSIHKSGRVNRFFELYNDASEITLTPYFLGEEYYSKSTKEIQKFIVNLLTNFWVKEETAKRTSEVIGMMPENDNAYRLRTQDGASETTIEALILNLPKELERVLTIMAPRETVQGGGQQVVERFKSFVKILKWVWRVPMFRKKIRNALAQVNLDNIRMDEADFYHSLLYGDYNAKGKTQEERLAIYAQYHGPDQAKWPPRILIRHQGNQWG